MWKCMKWEFRFTTTIGDHNLLISVKFLLQCHRWIWPCIQCVTLHSQTNNHEMHLDSHAEFLLDSFQNLLVFFFLTEVVLFVWFFYSNFESCLTQKVMLMGKYYGINMISDSVKWNSSHSCIYKHILKVTFLSSLSQALYYIVPLFEAEKQAYKPRQSQPFSSGALSRNWSSKYWRFCYCSFWTQICTTLGAYNFMTDFCEQAYKIKGKRKWELYEFDALKKCRWSSLIYLSFMVIINEYNFKGNVFTHHFLLVCFLLYVYLLNTFSKFDYFSLQTLKIVCN